MDDNIKKTEVVEVIKFKRFQSICYLAMKDAVLENPSSVAKNILDDGVPRMDQDNLIPFIKWAYAYLGDDIEDLPDQYFIETCDLLFAVSNGDCIIWKCKH